MAQANATLLQPVCKPYTRNVSEAKKAMIERREALYCRMVEAERAVTLAKNKWRVARDSYFKVLVQIERLDEREKRDKAAGIA